MARKLRVEYPGAIYHVMNRGDRREAMFRDEADRQGFVETPGRGLCAQCLASACVLSDVQSFSSGSRDSATHAGGRNEMVSGHLYGTVQPAAQILWARLQRTL